MAANRSGPLTIRAPRAGAALPARIRRSGSCSCRGARHPSAIGARVSPPQFRRVVLRHADAPANCRGDPRVGSSTRAGWARGLFGKLRPIRRRQFPGGGPSVTRRPGMSCAPPGITPGSDTLPGPSMRHRPSSGNAASAFRSIMGQNAAGVSPHRGKADRAGRGAGCKIVHARAQGQRR